MRILVIGGTIFLGRHFVESALANGHDLTLFNRGRHNPELFPEVERVHADRDGGLAALGDRTFDAVVDMCGYVPRIVRQSAEFLADRCTHYTFISSLSVYADNSVVGQDESAPVARIDDPTVEEITGETYGALKRLCEEQVERAFRDRALLVRPGLIVGPCDPTDRFTYWPWRMARGGEMIAPKPGDAKVEFTDVRDLARWILDGVEHARAGIYNVTGPSEDKVDFARFLEMCGTALLGPHKRCGTALLGPHKRCGTASDVVWVERDWLAEHDVALWSDLPLLTDLAGPGFSTRSARKALDAGMRFRPVDDTIRDTLEWAGANLTESLKAGLDPEREKTLLAKLKSER